MKTLIAENTEINVSYLQKTLHGASYPLAKSDVIELAELNFADGDMLDVLYALGDSDYYSLADIKQEIQYLVHDEVITEKNPFYMTFAGDDESDAYELNMY